MSKKQQIKKNLELSEKLANFLAKHPTFMTKTPENTSFVAFSSNDPGLNKMNMRLMESLLKEGRSVVKAQQTQNKQNPWKFTAVPA